MRALTYLCILCLLFLSAEAGADTKITSNMGGFVQIRYHDYQDESTASTFSVKRAHIRWFGDIGQDWMYFVQADLADKNNNYFRDAIIKWKKYDFINITAGQTFLPYSIVNEIPAFKAYLLDAPIPYLNLSRTRDVGIRLDGKLSSQIVHYAVGLYNGSDINNLDTNNFKDFSGKISIYPFKHVSQYTENFRIMAGYHISKNPLDDQLQSEKKRSHISYDYQYSNIRFFGEYFFQREEIENGSGKDTDSSGWYVTGAYKLSNIKHILLPSVLEGVLRFEYYDPDNDNSGDWQDAVTIGINIPINDYVKLQANYKFRDEAQDKANNEFIMQLQVKYGI